MKSSRWLLLGLALVCLSAFAQSQDAPPEFASSTTWDVNTRENDLVSFSFRASDPEGGSIAVTFTPPTSPSIDLQKLNATINSGSVLRNEFPVPPGTNGTTIEILVQIQDAAQNVVEGTFLIHVTGINYPPQVELLLSQSGNTEGSFTNPFRSGGIAVKTAISDQNGGGSYGYRWGSDNLGVFFCVGGHLIFFGAEGGEPVISVPRVSAKSRFRVSVEVTDGTHTIADSREFYVENPNGCSDDPPPTDLLDAVAGRASPTAVVYGQTISLIGSVTGQASPPANFSPTWFLENSTTGGNGTFLSNNWVSNYTAPQQTTVLQFRLVVTDGTREVVRRMSVTVEPPGGGGATSCPNCLSGLPPNVDAGPSVVQIVGGQTLNLNGSASDPNTPFGIPTPTTTWSVTSNPASLNVTIQNPNSAVTTLLTPVVQQQTSLTLELRADNTSGNGCYCTDQIIVTVLPQNQTRTALIQYAFPSQGFQNAANGATIQRTLSGSSVSIQLQATASGFTSPVYSWQSSAGTISSPSSSATSLDVTQIVGTLNVPVTLTVSESGNPSQSTQATATFSLTGSSKAAGIRYSFDGSSFQDATDGATIMRNIDSLPVNIQLQATSAGFTDPSYSWTASQGATVTSPSGQTSALQIDKVPGGSASIQVSLTVSETGSSSETGQSSVTFQLTAPIVTDPPTSVDFSVSVGDEAEPGTLVKLEGTAVSSQGTDIQFLDFQWHVETDTGASVEVFPNHTSALFVVPNSVGGAQQLVIDLDVSEGTATADPVTKTLDILLPSLNFAHFGAGPLPGGSEELEIELVLVNDSADDLSGITMEFLGQDGSPVELDVDGETASTVEFSVAADSAKGLTLRSPSEVQQGWISLRSPVQLTGIVLFKYIDEESGRANTETALFASQTGRRFTTAVRQGKNADLGVAVANPSSETVRFRISVKEEESGQALSTERELGPKQQMADFLPNLFGTFSIPESFGGGTLTVETVDGSEGNLVATILRLNNGFLSTVPLAVRR